MTATELEQAIEGIYNIKQPSKNRIKDLIIEYAKEKCKEQENRILGRFIFRGDFLVGTKDRKILDEILKKSRPKFD